MAKTMTASFALLALSLLMVSLTGCKDPVAKNSPVDERESLPATQPRPPETDLATQPNTLPDRDATAREVCQGFLGLLSRNQRRLAEQLLTQQASKVTMAAGLELEALGGPESTLKIGDAVYATSRAKVAQVPCTVTEKDGTEQSFCWMMRRGESGWRISGLIVDGGDSKEFLSLESKADVAAIMASKGQPAPSQNVRQVSALEGE